MAASSISEFMVRRDDEGKVVPIEVDVVGMENMRIAILPTTVGSLMGITSPDKDAITWPLDEKITYIREHIIEPDFRAITHDDVMDNLTMWDLDMLLITAVQNGGPQRRNAEGNLNGGKTPKKIKRSTRRRGQKA